MRREHRRVLRLAGAAVGCGHSKAEPLTVPEAIGQDAVVRIARPDEERHVTGDNQLARRMAWLRTRSKRRLSVDRHAGSRDRREQGAPSNNSHRITYFHWTLTNPPRNSRTTRR